MDDQESKEREAAAKIDLLKDNLVAVIVERQYRRQPEYTRYGPAGRKKCIEDAGKHLDFLVQALRVERSGLFTDYIRWASELMASRGLPAKSLSLFLEITGEELKAKLPEDFSAAVLAYIHEGHAALEIPDGTGTSCISPEKPLYHEALRYRDYLLTGRRKDAADQILALASGGTPVRSIYLNIFQPFQQELGRLWQRNEINVAQEHYATASTQLIMSQLYPIIFATPRRGTTVLAASVSGELHELGIRMVADLLELSGWDAYYLGANMPQEDIIRTIAEEKPDLLAFSVTLSIHLSKLETLINAVKEAPIAKAPKIIVGGAPFNAEPQLWKDFGADGYCADASAVAEKAAAIVGEPHS